MDTIVKKVKTDDRGKRVVSGLAQNIRAAASSVNLPQLLFGKKEPKPHPITDEAFIQLCSILGIPRDYVKSLPPKLRCDNINYWLSTLDKKTRWTILMKEKVVRGILTGRMPFSNMQIVEMVKGLSEIKDSKVLRDWVFLDDSTLHFRLLFPDVDLFFENEKRTKATMPGLHFSTSELGVHGFRCDFVMVREQSDSGIVAMVKRKRFYRPSKAFPTIDALREELEKSLAEFPKVVATFAERIKKARKQGLKDFPGWIDKLRKKYRFSTKIAERATEIFEGQEDKNLWMALNALARTARERLTGEKRYEVEALVGNVMDAK